MHFNIDRNQLYKYFWDDLRVSCLTYYYACAIDLIISPSIKLISQYSMAYTCEMCMAKASNSKRFQPDDLARIFYKLQRYVPWT